MPDEIAISLQNVSKKYKLYDNPIDRLKEALHPFKKQYHKDFYALKDINLEVKKGEVLGIVGVNGAGKSTLLKIVSGIIRVTSGQVKVSGSVNAMLELNAGLKNELTGIENIQLSLKINGVSDTDQTLLSEIVAFADLGEYINHPIKTYSSGMKSRLGFGIATSTDPDILIVDEVLAVGDAVFRKKCFEKINAMVNAGKTVLFVSHSVNSIVEFCSRAVLIFNRNIVLDDTPKIVTDFYQKLVFSNDSDALVQNLFNEDVVDELSDTATTASGEINPRLLEIEPSVIKSSEFIELQTIRLVDNNELQANVLYCDQGYSVVADLQVTESFLPSLRGKLIGLTLVNQKGIRIAGLRLEISSVTKGRVIAKGLFTCMLNTDIYSIIFSIKNEDYQPEYDLFIIDALMFEVRNDTNNVRWGYLQL